MRNNKSKGTPLQAGKPTLTALATLLMMLPALSSHAAEPTPGAGSILQQVQPVKPPTAESSSTGLTIQKQGKSDLPATQPFHVSSIQISGNTVFDTATLHALVTDAEGKDLSLQQLNVIVERITDYYQKHGYALARAAIPQQTIENGIVHVLVVEAHYGNVQLNNSSRVNNGLLQSTISPLQSGQQVEQKQLDHSLLLLSDIPGVAVSATLKPGTTVGTSDLEVTTAPTQPVTGSVSVDNDGNPYTGRTRLGASVNVFDPFHIGDIFTVSGLTTGGDLNYGSLSYEALLNGAGTRVGASYSALHYILGDSLSSSGGHGTADVGSIWVRQPIVRSHEGNLSVRLQYDHKQLDDESIGIQDDRHLSNLTLTLLGDVPDTLLAGAENTAALGVTSGRLNFDDFAAQQRDSTGAKTEGNFTKWTLNYARLQNLNVGNALYVNLFGQWASTNLDASEKLIAGGPYSVRAYDLGALSGDQGVLATVEFRHTLAPCPIGQFQLSAFIDSEHVTINKNAITSTTSTTNSDNSATLSGVGVGVNWVGPNQWTAKTYVAAPIGATPELIGHTSSARAWFELDKGF